jgi:putative DNA primase/helicase
MVRPTDRTRARYAERYSALGLSLLSTAPNSKHPAYRGWNKPENAVSPDYWINHPNHGIGALLGPSGLVSVDVDEESTAERVFQAFGVDLMALRKAGPCIVGRHFRLMFCAPDYELKHRTLKWPKESDPQYSSVIFELRAGLISDTLPPTIHPGIGLPYRWENPPCNGFPPLPPRLLELWMDWAEFSRAAVALCPWAPPPKPVLVARRRLQKGTPDSVIHAFNAVHDVAEILGQHGYQRRGNRFASPGTGHAAGIVLTNDGRAFCHHEGDPLSSEHAHDAFDVYRLLQHGGDFRLAVKAAAAMLRTGCADGR